MPSTPVSETIGAAIQAAWTHTPIRVGNAAANAPADGSAFLTVMYVSARERQISTGAPGANIWRTHGGVYIELAIPSSVAPNDVEAPWMDRLEALRDALRGKVFGNVETLGASGPTEDESSDLGAYYVYSIAVEYLADVIG
jgi:fermentation-respiration switch protein FrsA (DUF1100 family)